MAVDIHVEIDYVIVNYMVVFNNHSQNHLGIYSHLESVTLIVLHFFQKWTEIAFLSYTSDDSFPKCYTLIILQNKIK